MQLTVTQYHYLVIIAKLRKELREVKSIDIAVELGVARATTSRMINYLVAEGWIIRNRRALTLSDKAEQLLSENDEYLDILFKYFSKMNLDSFELKECLNAISMNVSNSTLQKICTYIKSHG